MSIRGKREKLRDQREAAQHTGSRPVGETQLGNKKLYKKLHTVHEDNRVFTVFVISDERFRLLPKLNKLFLSSGAVVTVMSSGVAVTVSGHNELMSWMVRECQLRACGQPYIKIVEARDRPPTRMDCYDYEIVYFRDSGIDCVFYPMKTEVSS